MSALRSRLWRSLRAVRTSSSYPILLTAFVTDHCGLRCRHCLFADHLNDLPGSGLQQPELERVFRRWPNIPWGIVTGGEPFLQSRLDDLLLPFLGSQGVCVLTIPTSGRYPEAIERVISACDDREGELPYVAINVSVYGPETLHDEITGISDSHRLAMESLARLVALAGTRPWLIPTLQFTVMHSNQQAGPETLAELSARFPRVRQAVNRVRAPVPDVEELRVDPSRLADAVRCAAAHNRGLFQARLLARLVAFRDALLETSGYVRPGQCTAGRRALVLGPDGNLRGCEWFYDRLLGDVRNERWDEIDQARAAFHSDAVRRRCSCTHECIRQVSGIDRVLRLPGR